METKNVLHEFFNSRSDANKYLTASQQEELEMEFNLWLDSVVPNNNILNNINDDLIEKIKYQESDVDFKNGTVLFSDIQEVLEKYKISQVPKKSDWIMVNSSIVPCDEDGDATTSDDLLIYWVNLQHAKPWYGMDVIKYDYDFYDYQRDTGRTVIKWKPIPLEGGPIPDEVFDLRSMKEYLNAIGV